jgi:hypothetical protein
MTGKGGMNTCKKGNIDLGKERRRERERREERSLI